MNDASRDQGSGKSGVDEILLEAASPNVYRLNAFRLLGAHVDTSAREISRQTDKVNMLKKFGKLTSHAVGALPLDPPPDPDAMRDAIQSLHDPECRIVDEFFWFWPRQLGQSRTDQAFEPLKRNDVEAAAEIWLEWEQSSDSNVSLHNLSVLYHCVALDWEQQAQFQPLTSEQREKTNTYWAQAFKRWSLLQQQEAFWSRLTDRVREMDDPRLTTGAARRMRQTLPVALLSINATLAVRAAEKERWEDAKCQVRLMSQSGLGQDVTDEALSRAVKPIRNRIKSLCQNAKRHAEAEQNHADREAQQLIDQAEPLLKIMDCVLPESSATREVARDEIAESVLTCQIQYGNRTKDWATCLKIIEQALPICAGQTLRARLEENIKIVKTNLEYGMCWFCKKKPNDDKAALEVKMFGDVNRVPTWQGTQIRWRHATIKVPRCSRCSSAHNTAANWLGVCGTLGLLIGLGGCIASASNDAPGPGFIVLLIGAGVGFGIGGAVGASQRPNDVKPQSAQNEFPGIKALLAQGWQFGEKPNTQQ